MGIEGDVVSCLYENASSWSRLCYFYLIGRRSRFLSFLVSCLELTSLFHSFSFLISQVFLLLSLFLKSLTSDLTIIMLRSKYKELRIYDKMPEIQDNKKILFHRFQEDNNSKMESKKIRF